LLTIPLVFGSISELKPEQIKEFQNTEQINESYWRPFAKELNKYLFQKINDEEIFASAGNSEMDRRHAAYLIGLKNLGRGKRQAAAESFRKALKIPAFGDHAFDISWALLAQIEKNPLFPAWAPTQHK
jgi:hypothetical protein